MKVSTTSDRLKQIMKERGLKQIDIIRMCDPFCKRHDIKLNKNDLSQYVSGKVIPKQDKLSILASALSVNEVWLMGYDVPMEPSSAPEVKAPPAPEMVLCSVPVYESVAAGFGAYAEDNVVDYMTLPFRTVAESKDYLVIRVLGDSMEPKICDGDFVMVRKQSSVDSGDVAVLYLDEDGLLKKVKYGDDWIELVSFNPYYPPRRFEGPDVLRIRIEGKVKQVIRNMD